MSEHLDDSGEPAVDPGGSPYEAPQVERVLRQLIDLIEAARPVPLSASSMINKDEVLDLLYEVSERLPDELRAARWLLKEREDFLARVRREGDDIIDQAAGRAEAMVARTEVVKAAESRARRIVDNAEAESRRLKHEAEDFCDQRLASFEAVLEKTLKVVTDGRSRLQGDPLSELVAEASPPPPPEEPVGGFYDQDDGNRPL